MKKIDFFKKLGLTEYSSKIYECLLNNGELNVKEISKYVTVPRNKIYESLQELEKQNRIVTINVTPKRFRIINIEKLRDEIQELQNMSETIIIQFANMQQLQENNSLFSTIEGQEGIKEYLIYYTQNSKKEILGCSSLQKVHFNNLKVYKQAIEKGVNVKMIALFDKKYVKSFKTYKNVGIEIRFFNTELYGDLLPRISIFDQKTARITVGKPEIKNPKEYLTTIIESQAFVNMLIIHFLQMWDNSIEFEDLIN